MKKFFSFYQTITVYLGQRSVCGSSLQTAREVKTMNTNKSRGALIVFEGGDRCGKTTQCDLLNNALTAEGIDVKLMKCPDRTTRIGQMINEYLGLKTDIEDHSIHLLFSANRWERLNVMLDHLKNGTTLIVDRYAYSGVAYTAVKPGFDMDWCKQPDIGLPQPDGVFYLTLSTEAAEGRVDFGEERYEKTDMQKSVAEIFNTLKDDCWKVIDADKTIDDLHGELLEACRMVINGAKDKPLKKLWTDGEYVL